MPTLIQLNGWEIEFQRKEDQTIEILSYYKKFGDIIVRNSVRTPSQDAFYEDRVLLLRGMDEQLDTNKLTPDQRDVVQTLIMLINPKHRAQFDRVFVFAPRCTSKTTRQLWNEWNNVITGKLDTEAPETNVMEEID